MKAALVLACFSAFSTSAGAATLESAYSRYDFAKCPAGLSSEPGIIDVRICRGPAGLSVVWTGEPDASSVDFSSAPVKEALGLGSFFEAEPTIEWRGRRVAGALRPFAAIVRYSFGPSIGRLSSSKLVVYRVGGKTSCVIGTATNNNAARALADRRAEAIDCGAGR